MEPIQLWLPTMGPSLGVQEVRWDMQRVFQAWNGEDRVWLLPWVEKPIRWQEGNGLCLLAVPSDTIECVDVFHIGENGYVYGPGAAVRFPNSQVDGLLGVWLTLHKVHMIEGECFLTADPTTDKQVRLRVPQFNDNRVEYIEESFDVTPGPFFPLVRLDETGFAMKWPPDGQPKTVFPDAESYAFYERQDPKAPFLHLHLKWPEPLYRLAPRGNSFDFLYHQGQMAKVVRESTCDHVGAFTKASVLANPYVAIGWSTPAHSWYWPSYFSWLRNRGNDHYHEDVLKNRNLRSAEEVFFEDTREQCKFTSNTLDKALGSGEWLAVMGRRIKIRRAWGILGLFWTLLLDQLKAKRIRTCEQCGRTIQGREQKKYCGSEDDIACYRRRRAEDRARERAYDTRRR